VCSGDSLVGLTVRQLADFHWQHERRQERVFGQEFIESRIATATTARRIILTAADDYTSPDLKNQKLQVADAALNPVRQAGDMVIAAFFNGETKKERAKLREEYLGQYTRFGREFDPALDPEPIVRELRGGNYSVRPFHWEIEFPEVFQRENSGFDALVGNPPFLGGKRISTVSGEAYRDWLAVAHEDSSSNADLVAHFTTVRPIGQDESFLAAGIGANVKAFDTVRPATEGEPERWRSDERSRSRHRRSSARADRASRSRCGADPGR
jgi:hypothetical protein